MKSGTGCHWTTGSCLKELSMKGSPEQDVVIQSIQEALVLLGNASCHMSGERRSRALTKLNPDLKSMAKEENYSDAQPFLFGKGFEQKVKERTEALKCLQRATTQKPSQSRNFFWKDRPCQYGGSGGENSSHCTQHYYRSSTQGQFKKPTHRPQGTEGGRTH